MTDRLRSIVAPGIVLLAIALAWEGAVRWFDVLPLVLPGPLAVIQSAQEEGGTLLAAAWSTFVEIVLAGTVAIVVGFVTAALMSMSERARRVIFPYMLMTQVMPKVALAPILIVWFGTGMQSRLVLAFLIAYFPMVINTLAGLVGTGDAMLRYTQSLAASEWQVFLKVRLPAALPSIVGGIKITTGVTVIGIVVGEFVASDGGLGMVIINSVADLDTPLTVAATLTIAALGLVLLGAVEVMERRLVYWQAGR